MKLRAIDQVHVSSVKADSLRPGDEFVVSDAYGDELLTKHADKFEKVDDVEKFGSVLPIEKSETAPLNKADLAPANKADQRKKHGKGD